MHIALAIEHKQLRLGMRLKYRGMYRIKRVDMPSPLTDIYGMAKRGKQSKRSRYPNYGRVLIEDLKKSRKGKHHDLMNRIMEDLRKSEVAFAVQIPLSETGDVSILNLRSAIGRAAAKEKLKIMTSSDDEYFYVWKAGNTR